MATTTETVFVEFVVSGEDSIQTAQQTLQKTGQVDKAAADEFKKTNAELARRQQIINNLNKELRATQAQNAKSIADLEAKVEKFVTDFAEGFQEGIIEALKEAGLEFDEFGKVVNRNNENASKSANTAKARLSELTKNIQAAKVAGETTTEQYKEWVREAGNLRSALGDVNKEINTAADSEGKLHGLMEIGNGIAGAFGIAASATALFGGESDSLDKALTPVIASLTIMQGIESIIAITKKESAAATVIQTIAEQAYNIVVGESIGLLKGLRIALAATGIGAAVLGIIALVQWMNRASASTKELTQDFTAFNNATQIHLKEVNDALAENGRIFEENQTRLKAAGAKQSEINKQEIDDLRTTQQALFQLEQQQRDKAAAAQQALDEMSSGERSYNKDLEAEAQKTVATFEETKNRRKDIANQVRINEVNNEKQIVQETLQAQIDGANARLSNAVKNSSKEFAAQREVARAEAALQLEEAGQNLEKRLLIEAQLQRRIREINLEQSRVRQEDRVAAAEKELLAVQDKSNEISDRNSQEDVDAQKRVIAESARLSLLQEGLTQNQRLSIIQKSLSDQLKLQRDFNKQSNIDSLNDYIALNKAQLSNLNLTEKERLQLTEENIIAAAQIEIENSKGLASQIKAIRAKMNEDIRAARLASIEKQLADELSLEASRTGALRRSSERIAANENKSLSKRLAAINQIAALDIANINKREDALNEELRKGLISQQEYNVKYASLLDEEAKIVEETELKKRQLRFETNRQQVLLALDTASQIASIIQQFGQQETDREQQRIDEQRARIDELREAGAITEKNALARQKKLDNEEKALKRKQAERDKAVAIFQAVISTAAGIAKALPNLVLAGIAAALGAAQIALIASKPIPKFGKGKRNTYSGPAEIGETGPELLQSNGEMYLAKKSTLVWVGAKDVVYNPKETLAMMGGTNMQPYILKDPGTNEYKSVYTNNLDYDKLGKVISDNMPNVGVNIDENGIVHYMKHKNSFTNYLDNRRSYK